MLRHILLFALILASSFSPAVKPSDQAEKASYRPRLTCSVSTDENSVVVKFGVSKHPTYFGVQNPADDFIYLRYPPRGIDILGKKYKGDTIKLDIANLQGVRLVNDTALPTKVFSTPGKYTLRFQDANRAAYEDLHSLSCNVTIGVATSKNNAVISKEACQNRITYTSSTVVTSSMQAIRVGCNYTGGCAEGWPCCNQAFPGQPCYCST